MGIISRYILREIVTSFFIALFAFTGILLTVRLLKLTELIVNKGVGPWQVGGVLLAIIPTFLEIALPMAALLGVMIAFARLSGDSELVVIRASGISLSRLITPVATFGVVAALLALYVTLQLRPWGYEKLAQSIFDIARSKSTAGLSAGTFNQLGSLILYAEQIDYHTGDLTGVVVDDKRRSEGRKIVFAKSGLIASDPRTQRIIFELKEGEIHEVIEKRYVTTRFNTNEISLSASEVYDPDAARQQRRARQLTQAELEQALADTKALLAAHADSPDSELFSLPEVLGGEETTLKQLRRQYASLVVEQGQRFSMPFAVLALALLAFPLGVQPPRVQRTWGLGLSAVLALAVFVFYYALLSIGIALAERGTLPPIIALWMPNLAVFLIAVLGLRKMGTERWQSIAHGIERMFQRVQRPASSTGRPVR